MAEDSSNYFRFLDLPREIRNQIYGYCLDAREVKRLSDTGASTPPIKDWEAIIKSRSGPPFDLQLSILYINRQIYNEAKYFFLSTNLFIRMVLFHDDEDAASRFLQIATVRHFGTHPEIVHKCGNHAMDIKVSCQGSQTPQVAIIFPKYGLADIVGALFALIHCHESWRAQTTEIDLAVLRSYGLAPKLLKRSLFTGFEKLHGFHKVTIKADIVGEDFVNKLAFDMMTHEVDCTRWLEDLLYLKELGRNALYLGEIMLSVLYVTRVLRTARKGYQDRGQMLTSLDTQDIALEPRMLGLIKHILGSEVVDEHPQSRYLFSRAVCRLVFQVCLDCGLVAHELHDENPFTDQYFLVEHPIEDAVAISEGSENSMLFGAGRFDFVPKNDASWYSDAERAKARYRRGILELFREANHLAKAHQLSPADPVIWKALSECRARISACKAHDAEIGFIVDPSE